MNLEWYCLCPDLPKILVPTSEVTNRLSHMDVMAYNNNLSFYVPQYSGEAKLCLVKKNHSVISFQVILSLNSMSFLKNGPTPASFSFIFGLFKQTIQFFNKSM